MRRDIDGWLWRRVVRRLTRAIPPSRCAAALGDLAEDYERRRARGSSVEAGIWLIREARSLERAYRVSKSLNPQISKSRNVLMLGDDLRHAARRLVARPAVPLLCAALLAVGVGLATAIFGVVDSLLLRPAPFRDADRFVFQGLPPSSGPFLRQIADGWRATTVVDSVGVTAAQRPLQVDALDADAWSVVSLTPGLLDLLGVSPIRGQLLATDQPDGSSLLLSEIVWRRAFGADERILGRRVSVDGTPRTVVGIMPAAFRFPTPTTVAWTPFDLRERPPSGALNVIGKLHGRMPLADADRHLRDIAFRIAPMPNRAGGPPVAALVDSRVNSFTRQALWLLLSGTALVFVVLCANVSSLLLTQLAARRHEFGLCTALGASRARLLRQSVFEHTLIVAAGAAAGVALASVLTAAVPAIFLDRTLNPIDVDVRAVAVAVTLGFAAVVISGVLPAWLGTRARPLETLNTPRLGAPDSRSNRVAIRALLVGEVALACALLVGSAILARSLANLLTAERGLNVDGIVVVRVTSLDEAFPSPELMRTGTAAIEAQARTWPEVLEVALSREIPPVASTGLLLAAGAAGGTPPAIPHDRYRVSAEYFRMYGIPILAGRVFQPDDTDDDVILGERLASILSPDRNPVGSSLTINTRTRRVIGIAGEVSLPTLDRDLDRPELYVPLGSGSRTLYLSLRCRSGCPDEATMRARLGALHPVITPRRVPALELEYQTQLELPRAIAVVGGVFAIVALVVASAGLFSVLSQAVARRRREFGIRAALGAAPAQMRRLVLRDSLTIVGLGVASGAAGGWLVARALVALQYGVAPGDPLTWAAVLGTMAATTLAASWRPARQAGRVDPVRLLREE